MEDDYYKDILKGDGPKAKLGLYGNHLQAPNEYPENISRAMVLEERRKIDEGMWRRLPGEPFSYGDSRELGANYHRGGLDMDQELALDAMRKEIKAEKIKRLAPEPGSFASYVDAFLHAYGWRYGHMGKTFMREHKRLSDLMDPNFDPVVEMEAGDGIVLPDRPRGKGYLPYGGFEGA